MKTFNELLNAVLTIFPEALIEQDASGELQVSTGYKLSGEFGQNIEPIGKD